MKCFGDGGNSEVEETSPSGLRPLSFWTAGSGTLEPALRGSGARLRFLSNKGQKAGVHVGSMTQHLSLLQPGSRRFSGPRSLLPPKHVLFSGSEQSRPLGLGLGPGAGGAGRRAAHGGCSPRPFFLLPRLSLGSRSRRGSLGRAGPRESAGRNAPGRGLVAEAVSRTWGLGASCAGASALASVGRGKQTGAISRAARGSGGGGRCAPGGGREAAGGGEAVAHALGRRGRGRPWP